MLVLTLTPEPGILSGDSFSEDILHGSLYMVVIKLRFKDISVYRLKGKHNGKNTLTTTAEC